MKPTVLPPFEQEQPRGLFGDLESLDHYLQACCYGLEIPITDDPDVDSRKAQSAIRITQSRLATARLALREIATVHGGAARFAHTGPERAWPRELSKDSETALQQQIGRQTILARELMDPLGELGSSIRTLGTEGDFGRVHALALRTVERDVQRIMDMQR